MKTGNPLSDGTWTYTWQAGRQLKSMSKTEGSDTVTMEFTYNYAGLRTKKVRKVNGVIKETTEYILNGKNVVELIHTNHAKSVTNRLHFFYDAQGKHAMLEFNGTKYSYIYNLQGDVIGIVDSTGNVVVQYRYDTWGKPIGTTASTTLTTELAELNPFRYRRYIWDLETELYYLKSRYYAPMLCRFSTTDSSLASNNSLYIYCSNNAVMKVDSNGCSDEDISLTITVRMWYSGTEAEKNEGNTYTGHFDMIIWDYDKTGDTHWQCKNLVLSYASGNFTVFKEEDSLLYYQSESSSYSDGIEEYYYFYTCSVDQVDNMLSRIRNNVDLTAPTYEYTGEGFTRSVLCMDYKMGNEWGTPNNETGINCFGACALWLKWAGNTALFDIQKPNGKLTDYTNYTASAFANQGFRIGGVEFVKKERWE